MSVNDNRSNHRGKRRRSIDSTKPPKKQKAVKATARSSASVANGRSSSGHGRQRQQRGVATVRRDSTQNRRHEKYPSLSFGYLNESPDDDGALSVHPPPEVGERTSVVRRVHVSNKQSDDSARNGDRGDDRSSRGKPKAAWIPKRKSSQRGPSPRLSLSNSRNSQSSNGSRGSDSTGRHRRGSNGSARACSSSDASNSDPSECPICKQDISSFAPASQRKHVNSCIDNGAVEQQRKRPRLRHARGSGDDDDDDDVVFEGTKQQLPKKRRGRRNRAEEDEDYVPQGQSKAKQAKQAKQGTLNKWVTRQPPRRSKRLSKQDSAASAGKQRGKKRRRTGPVAVLGAVCSWEKLVVGIVTPCLMAAAQRWSPGPRCGWLRGLSQAAQGGAALAVQVAQREGARCGDAE